MTECDFLPLTHDTHITYTLARQSIHATATNEFIVSSFYLGNRESQQLSPFAQLSKFISSYWIFIDTPSFHITLRCEWMSFEQMLGFHLCTFTSFSFFSFSRCEGACFWPTFMSSIVKWPYKIERLVKTYSHLPLTFYFYMVSQRT